MSERERNGLEIAVIGLAGRFPGAGDYRRFWDNLERGLEARTELSDEELAAVGVPRELMRHPSYVKAAPVLEGFDRFDAEFFGMTPREAELADPQQRLFLECAWESLEDAAWDPTTRDGRVAVFASSSFSRYGRDVLAPRGSGGAGLTAALVGGDRDFLATRVAYKLDLRGPSLTVQTACSSSLVGVHLACQTLLSGGCDVALAGGASVSVPQRVGYLHEPESILSPDGRCRAFDDGAAGCMRGSGVGLVVLRRLEDALEDGDPVRAVILGSAVNNDGGAKVGFTAPAVPGQEQVLRAALALAEVEPESIGYVEAHGTGTALGDPVEVEALNRVFAGPGPRSEPCWIGSVKTNVGHLDATAGVTGLIKTVLALERGRIPESLHFRTPNRRIDWARVPFEVPRETVDWRPTAGPRRAGVSSFGIGGTNAHVVLEEPPPAPASASSSSWHLLPLSARTGAALDAAAARLADHLEREPADLADVARTLALGRRAFPHRRIVVAREVPEAVAALRQPSERRHRGSTGGEVREAVFLLPGQGSRTVDRGRELYAAEPAFREALDRCAEIVRPWVGEDLRRLLHPGDGEGEAAAEALAGTRLAQPALFSLEYALARTWMSWGVSPAALLGHSLGEWVAACLAGVFSLEDALALVAARGRLMAGAPSGAMAAVALAPSAVESRLGGALSLAAANAPDQSVISGEEAELAELEAELTGEGVRCTRLHVDHAFHSPLLDTVVPELVDEVRKRSLRPPEIPILSNVTGRPLSAEEATRPEYWGEHLRRTVRFADGLEWLLDRSHRAFVEVGPGRALAGLVRRRAPDATVVPSLPDAPGEAPQPALARASLGRLWVAGVTVDWRSFHGGSPRRRIPLPTYPFERRRYLIEPAAREESDSHDPGAALEVPVFRREELPLAVAASGALAGEDRWLLVGDGPVAAALAERLGDWAEVVSRDEDAVALLEGLEPSDRLSRVVHFADGLPGLLTLARACARVAAARPIHLTVVGRGLCPVLGDDASPEGALLAGLASAIPRELAGVSCAVVDLGGRGEPPAEPSVLADRLAAEAAAGGAPVPAVAYRGRHRWVRTGRAISPGAVSGAVEPGAGGGADGPELPSLGSELRERLRRREEAISRDHAVRSLDELPGFEAAANRLCAAYALGYLRDGGALPAPGEPVPEGEICEHLGVLPQFRKLLDLLLELLVEQGWATRAGGSLTVSVDPAAVDPAALSAEVRGRYPELEGILSLLDHCVRAYAAALSGEEEAIGVLYPEGSYDFLREHLRELREFRWERVYLQLLCAALPELAGLGDGRPMRILEVGAGNGLLTEEVSEVLSGHRVHYCFTDLGNSFVQRASRRRSELGFERMDFRVFDISRDPVAQGLEAGGFDLVLAYNVVHATARVDVSLGHLQTTLAPGGVLCLLEGTRSHPWLDMIFGLAEGWWYFDDPFRPRSALMPASRWRERLEGLGFAPVWPFPESPEAAADAALLLAQRPGTDRSRKSVGGQETAVPEAQIRTLELPARALTEGSEEGWVASLRDGIARLDELRRKAGETATRAITLLALDDPGSGSAGRALQSALGAYAEATAGAPGETTVCLDAPAGGGELAAALAVPPGYALAFRRSPIARDEAPAEAPVAEAEDGEPAGVLDPVAEAVLDILRDLLGVERVKPGDRFVELGGDSLLALQVLSRVRRELGIELRVRDLMEDRPLAQLLARASRPGRGAAALGEGSPFSGRLPLLPSQAWYFERPLHEPNLNTVPLLWEVKEELHEGALRDALAHLHRVHDSLRVRIGGDGGGRHQEVDPPGGEVPFHCVDLSGLEASRRETVARRLAAQTQGRVDLFDGPIQRVVWFDLGGSDCDRLLVSTHHIAFDARSLQIFFEDLWTAYRDRSAGEPIGITPPSGTLPGWIADLERYLESPRADADLRYWTAQPWEKTAEIPLDETLGPNVLGSAEEVFFELGGEVGGDLLRRLPRLHGVDVQEIVLAGVVAALAGWTGEHRHMVHVVGHGREPFAGGTDPERIIGWFSTPGHPVLLRHHEDPVRSLGAVSRQVRSVPDAGQSFPVLRYFSRDPAVREAIRRIPDTRILFNYVSRFSDALGSGLPGRLLEDSLGDTVDPRRERGILLKVAAAAAPGDRLRVRFGYSANLHRRSTVEELSERCRTWLHGLAGRPED